MEQINCQVVRQIFNICAKIEPLWILLKKLSRKKIVLSKSGFLFHLKKDGSIDMTLFLSLTITGIDSFQLLNYWETLKSSLPSPPPPPFLFLYKSLKTSTNVKNCTLTFYKLIFGNFVTVTVLSEFSELPFVATWK